MPVTRRDFLISLGVAAAAFPLKSLPGRRNLKRRIEVLPAAASSIKLGYAAITWNGNDELAIKEVAEVGFRGIQLRSNILKDYGERPKALRELLDQHHLELVALSSGGVGLAPGTETAEIDKHMRNAKFVHDVGGHYLQVTDSARPKGRKPESADFKQLGRLLTEIGKRSNDLGVPVGYHNHMDSLGESPDEVNWIMEAADPRYVKLELDIAHYQQGGGDPVKAVRQYRERLLFLHIKDVETLAAADDRGRAYRWVELGGGRVDVPAVFAALKEVGFHGWAVVELDSVPDKTRTPKDYALVNRQYLEKKLGMKVG